MSLTPGQREYLGLMGIDVWVSRVSTAPAAAAAAVKVDAGPDDADRQERWRVLREQVSVCTKCQLHQGRTQTVFGTGSARAGWMLIGEAPGADEDKQGKPFVGRAGKLLTAMLQAIGLSRDEVFIANILKCRPPNNRDPKPEEVVACEGYLKQQIEHVRPKIILALGRIAAQNLLKVDTPIGKMRGRYYEHPDLGIPVVVTYHPAYLLRSPREKLKSWQDLQAAVKLYNKVSS
jgi:DNA polymerase